MFTQKLILSLRFVGLLDSRASYWAYTRKAFIFSISNKEELTPFVTKVNRPERAITRWSGYGPRFGINIEIANNANSNSDSFAGLGWYYPPPAAVQDRLTILAGTFHFSPDEVEVFYLYRDQ